jgi:hypothetical protein
MKELLTVESLADIVKGLPKYEHTLIVESDVCVVDGEPYNRVRPWRERLFSRPWRPLKKTVRVVPKVPLDGGYQMGDFLLVHPVTMQRIRENVR